MISIISSFLKATQKKFNCKKTVLIGDVVDWHSISYHEKPTSRSNPHEEFIKAYNGEGIQHIALATDDIYQTVTDLKSRGLAFMDTPDTYYEAVNDRVQGHGESIEQLRDLRILIDGAPEKDGILLQIFTDTVIGPVFFEIIQRKGNEGFGEGNFKALFESIEQDQIRRGVLNVEDGNA